MNRPSLVKELAAKIDKLNDVTRQADGRKSLHECNKALIKRLQVLSDALAKIRLRATLQGRSGELSNSQ